MITDQMVETVARAIDDFEMPDGDPFGVLIFNSDYVAQGFMADMVEQKAEIIRSIARAALTAALGDAGWQDISTAPSAGHVIAARFDEREWIYAAVSSPPTKPFTHWQMLPTPPVTRQNGEEGVA